MLLGERQAGQGELPVIDHVVLSGSPSSADRLRMAATGVLRSQFGSEWRPVPLPHPYLIHDTPQSKLQSASGTNVRGSTVRQSVTGITSITATLSKLDSKASEEKVKAVLEPTLPAYSPQMSTNGPH